MGPNFSSRLVRRHLLIGLGPWPCRYGLVAAEREDGVRGVVGGVLFGSFPWATATVSPICDQIWLWPPGARSWLCFTAPIALASKRGRVGSRWMGGWDQVSLVLWPVGLFGVVMNFNRLGWCLVIDLKGDGWFSSGWI